MSDFEKNVARAYAIFGEITAGSDGYRISMFHAPPDPKRTDDETLLWNAHLGGFSAAHEDIVEAVSRLGDSMLRTTQAQQARSAETSTKLAGVLKRHGFVTPTERVGLDGEITRVSNSQEAVTP